MSAVNCVAAMIARPKKPRMQPTVLAVENSLFMSDSVLSMRYTSSKRVYDAMFSGVPKVVFFENLSGKTTKLEGTKAKRQKENKYRPKGEAGCL